MRPSIAMPTALVSAALAGWVSFHFWGPYKWAASLQNWAFGTHWVQLSFLFAWGIIGLPFIGIAMVLDKRLPFDASRELRWNRLDAMMDGTSGKVLLVGLTMAAMGTWLGLRDSTAGPLTTVSLASIEHGDAPPSLYVDLTGARAVEEGTIRFKDSSSESRFVPLLAGDDGLPVVFAKLSATESVLDPARGTLEEDGLPGEVRSAYENAGVIGPRHYVLTVNRNPADSARFAWGMAAVGFGVACVGFGMGRR